MPYTYKYPRPSVTVDCIIFYKGGEGTKVLLINRGEEPFKGKWAFPGGFLEMNEEIIDAAKRELKEETGLEIETLEQLHTFGTIGRDPRGRTVSIIHYGFTDGANLDVKGGDDASKAQWFSIDDIPDLAFDHNEIIKIALRKIKP